MSHLSKLQLRKPGHGKFIWLFSHIKTHQVLYSLDAYPNERKMLKQLNFYGKQTQAQEIRRDLFRPFAAVVTPSPEFGMNVYQKLREYRHVRDYQWTFRPTAQEVEETLQEAVKKKKMPKFDNRLPTLKERGKLLMDQKASTIADLAHILERESAIARNKHMLEVERVKKAEDVKEAEWARVEKMALRARAGELEKYEEWIARREDKITSSEDGKSKACGRKGLMMLKIKRNELLRAQQALDFVEGHEIPLRQRLKWNQRLSAMVQSRTERRVNPEIPLSPLKDKETEKTDPIHVRDSSKTSDKAHIDSQSRPDIREMHEEYQGPDDILIQWKDMNDAYHAKDWPPEVMHDQVLELTQGDFQPYNKATVKKRVTRNFDPDSDFPGDEYVMNGEPTAEENKVEEQKRGKGFMGSFTDAVKAPFMGGSVKGNGEEARR